MLIIIDYGMGNLRSVQKGFERVGCRPVISRDPSQIGQADGIVLPGVGAFRDGMQHLAEYGLIEPIKSHIAKGLPFLGICLGLQMLFEESEEFGCEKGLGVFKGRVVRFPRDMELKVPHMGWNQLQIIRRPPILQDVPPSSFVYFVHSYYVVPEDKAIVAVTSSYGVEFCSMIWQDNIFATQFHPEKSQELGLGILKRFAELCI